MSRNTRAYGSLLAVVLLGCIAASAQIEMQHPTGEEKNAIGVSAFIGPSLSRNAYFYGIFAEYDRLLTSKWTLGVAVDASWEPVHAAKADRSLSLTLSGGYSLTRRLSAQLLYEKEFARNGSDTNYHWQSTNGDNSVGVCASYTFWEKGRHGLALSFGLERDITASETSANFMLGYAFSF